MSIRELKVEGRPDLVRDTSTNAIINTNNSKAEKARKIAEAARNKNKEFEDMKQDLADIKDLLKQLLDR